MLIFAYIKAARYGIFNFENVFVSYTRYIKTHEQQNNQVQSISRAQFLKLFLDLIDKGFLRSESDMDILNVNNKIAMGFNIDDFRLLVSQPKTLEQLQLPTGIHSLLMAN